MAPDGSWLLPLGEISVALGQALATTQLRGLLATATFFYCLSFPVITSAALMPGGYGA